MNDLLRSIFYLPVLVLGMIAVGFLYVAGYVLDRGSCALRYACCWCWIHEGTIYRWVFGRPSCDEEYRDECSSSDSKSI